MPRGDRTGPMGMGPKTGRGMGYCNGFAAPGAMNQAGFAGGRGCGYRHMAFVAGMPGRARYGVPAAPGAAFDEKAALRSQAEALNAQLTQINQRLNDLTQDDE